LVLLSRLAKLSLAKEQTSTPGTSCLDGTTREEVGDTTSTAISLKSAVYKIVPVWFGSTYASSFAA